MIQQPRVVGLALLLGLTWYLPPYPCHIGFECSASNADSAQNIGPNGEQARRLPVVSRGRHHGYTWRLHRYLSQGDIATIPAYLVVADSFAVPGNTVDPRKWSQAGSSFA